MTVLSVERTFKKKNIYAQQGMIALGFNESYKHGIEYQYRIFTIFNKILGLTTLLSAPSSGKSVLIKRILCYKKLIEPLRPMVIFDGQGQDHRTNRFPGKEGYIFKEQGEEFFGFGTDQINFTPAYLKEELPPKSDIFDDDLFTICWRDLSAEEWDYLLGQGTVGQTWVFKLIEFISTNSDQITSLKDIVEDARKRFYQIISKQEITYSPNLPDLLSSSELQSLITTMRTIVESKLLCEIDDKLRFDIVKAIKPGVVINLSFWQDRQYRTKLYVGHLLRRLYEHARKEYNTHFPYAEPAPCVILEEADKVAGKDGPQDYNPASYWWEEMINKGLKYKFWLAQLIQNAKRMSSGVRDAIIVDEIFLARVNNDDLQEICTQFPGLKDVLIDMDARPSPTMRSVEWCHISKSKEYYTFRPGASMCEFLQRFDQKKSTET